MESPTSIDLHRLLIYGLLISELFNLNQLKSQLKIFPLIRSILLFIMGLLLIGFSDLRHSPVLNIYRLLDYFIQTFLLIFLAYSNIKRLEDWDKILKFLLLAAFMASIYGFYIFISKTNPLDLLITETYHSDSNFAEYALNDTRFRVNAFSSHPIFYGYLAGILFLIGVYTFYLKSKFKTISLFLIPMTFLNIVISNSRTALVSTLLGVITFIFIAFTKKKIVKIFIVGSIFCLITYFIPSVKENIDNTIDLFVTGGQNTVGSNLELRTNQLNASFKEFSISPLFGNGFLYINENLGASNTASRVTSDEDFAGFESYIYHLMIEEGIVGILINVIIFANIISIFYKGMASSKEIAGLGLAITIMFITFIVGTGALHESWAITMTLIGVLMKLLYLNQRRPAIESQAKVLSK